MTREEEIEKIKKEAEQFVKDFLPSWEKYCEVCGACNCQNNDSCIKCNHEFK